MSDRWLDAFERTSAKIVGHRKFRRLIMAVAPDESPGFPGYQRMRRNSLTYGSWVYRGNDGRPHQWPAFNPRGQRLAALIANELQIFPDLPDGESVARVYGEARDWIGMRCMP